MKWIFILFLPLLVTAETPQLVPKYGFEKNIVKEGIGSGERLWGLEYIYPIGDHMKLKADGGVWIARQAGRKTSVYFAPAWGYRIVPFKGIYVEAYIGVGLISRPDSQLGGHFQIFHDVNFGFSQGGWGLGLGFKHISSAGIYSPNKGRDFLGPRFMMDL